MNVVINGVAYPAEVMTTKDEIRTGMMGRTDLNGCMVFEMGRGAHSFWMKNCLIDLDIVFVLNGRITSIHKNCQPPHRNTLKPVTYTGYGDVVIEFPSHSAPQLGIGDRVFYQ